MHSCGYVHNDLKLQNILVGKNDPENIYLIDFGLSCPYLDAEGNHVDQKFMGKFSGNFLFASQNSCGGNTKSRRDDIQGLMNIMAYLLNKNVLPWSDFHSKFEDRDFKAFLKERLKTKYTIEVLDLFSPNLREIMMKVYCMKYSDEPPYD